MPPSCSVENLFSNYANQEASSCLSPHSCPAADCGSSHVRPDAEPALSAAPLPPQPRACLSRTAPLCFSKCGPWARVATITWAPVSSEFLTHHRRPSRKLGGLELQYLCPKVFQTGGHLARAGVPGRPRLSLRTVILSALLTGRRRLLESLSLSENPLPVFTPHSLVWPSHLSRPQDSEGSCGHWRSGAGPC